MLNVISSCEILGDTTVFHTLSGVSFVLIPSLRFHTNFNAKRVKGRVQNIRERDTLR